MLKPSAQKNWTEESAEDFLSRITFDFIAQIEKQMEKLNMPQVELAKKLGVTESSVSQVLSNSGNITLKTIIKYARAVGLKVSLVAYDDGDSENNKGLVNAEIFEICWQKQGKPIDFFEV